MECPISTRRRLVVILLAIPLVPALLWGLVLAVAPTSWAKARLIVELESATGRKVDIASLRVGLLGNLQVRGITISETSKRDDPWLRVAEARLDVHLAQILVGCCQPTAIEVDGLDLRVHRRSDGSLEFADLLKPGRDSRPSRTASKADTSSILHFRFTGAHVEMRDDPSSTRLELSDAEGSATWADSTATIESVTGRLNGGSFECAAKYTPAATAFELEMRARGVALGVGMRSLDLLVPVVSDVAESLDGRIDLTIALQGRGDTLDSIKSVLKGHGAIRVDPIDMSGSKLIDSLESLRQIPRSNRIGAIESHFGIEQRRIRSDDLTLKVAGLPLMMAGWTDFDGHLDYQMKTEAIRSRLKGKLPAEAQAILSEFKTEIEDLASIRITGTVDAPRVSMGSMGTGQAAPDLDQRARLREAAGKLRDRILR